MTKTMHILGVIIGYAISVTAIIIGALNAVPDFAGWKFVLLGLALAVCSTVALLDGAQAIPSVGWFKAKAKFEGLSDVGVILIAAVLVIVSLILMFS